MSYDPELDILMEVDADGYPTARAVALREMLESMRTRVPSGVQFRDHTTGENMVLVSDDDPWEHLRGWIAVKHPDGRWVGRRRPNDKDIRRIHKAVVHELGYDPRRLRRL
jgi:hypothetical protein